MRLIVAGLLFVAGTVTIPRWWCGREGKRWLGGDAALTSALGREVAATVSRGVTAEEFTSDSELFRHEWQFGTYQMAALGLLQACREHPALRSELLPAADRAIEKLLSSEVRRFDSLKWGEDPLDSLAGPNGHAAYLGYLNLVLSVHRCWVPGSRFASINDQITAALIRRFRASQTGILETYPGEAYPVDIAAALASVMLHQRATGEDHTAVVSPVLARYRTTWRDPKSGLLFQAVDARDGAPIDRARASGSALAAFFISFGEREVSRELFVAVSSQLPRSIIGFGFVREYPTYFHGGHGDIDSGPLILGISPSATGFCIAGSRVFGDHDLFIRLYRTAHLVGTPVSRDGRRFFVTGGPLGNAIMLAMLTAQLTPP
jgi:hypothetical protein